MTTSKDMLDIQVRLGVLEKLVDRVFDAVSKAEVAAKTADKALQMSQEALGLFAMHQEKQTPTQEENEWEIPVMPGIKLGEKPTNGEGKELLGNDELGGIIS